MQQNEHIDIGKIFKSRRESLKITIEEVSQNLKVKNRDIVFLEQSNTKLITYNLYLPGLIKSYGKMLGIKDDALEEYLKNISFNNKNIQITNLGIEQNKNPSRDDLINAMLIFLMIYLLLISFSQFKTKSSAVTNLITNQFNKIPE